MADYNQNTNPYNTSENYEHFNSDGTKKKNKGDKKQGPFLKGVVVLILLVAVTALGNSMVITQQNQFKLIRQFGRVQRVVTDAGLSFKIPFI